MEAPFALNSVEEVAGYDLMKCGLYRTLPPEGKEIIKKNKYVLQYLHMIPLERIGTPKFYKELSRKLKEMKDPNVIYPVSDEIAVHICPDKNDARNYYIPIEPHLFQDLSDLIAEVEKRIALLVDKYEEPRNKEEQRKILEKCIDEVCVVVPLKGAEYLGRRGMLLHAANLRAANPSGNRFSRIFNALRSLFLDGHGKIPVTPFELRAIKYLMVRDKVGLGVLEPFIHDPYIEDISCSGLGNIFIEHKIFESLKAPIVFESEEELDDFVLKLSEKIGKPVSFRNPIVDATLPDGSRINIVFGRDISKKGSNFTIRKFSKKPLSVLQLIEFGTFNYLMAAYFWIALREGMNCFVAGETASGKTTTLNAITTFVPPNAKIVSIEDTPEVQIPHKNWLREVTRSAGERKGSETSSVEMFDLLKAALRQRPNLIIVGEIRGIEGNIAFQAMQCIADGYILKTDGEFVSIKELFEYFKAKRGIIKACGEVVALKRGDLKVFASDVNDLDVKESEVTAIYKMPVAPLIEISLDDGQKLRVSENHKFICRVKGEIKELEAREMLDLHTKNEIFVYKPVKVDVKADERDLWELIDMCEKKPNVVKDDKFEELLDRFRSKHKFYVKEIASSLKMERKRVEEYFKKRSKVVSWEIYRYLMKYFGEEMPEEMKFRFKGAREDVVLNKDLKDFLYFLGVFTAKGHIIRNKIILNIREDVAERIKIPFKLRKDERGRYFVNSAPLIWLIREVFKYDGAIPRAVLKMPNSQLKYFIDGIESCASSYMIPLGEWKFWYAIGRLMGDDSLFVCYKDGKVVDYRWQVKNVREDEGVRWAEDAKRIIPNHARRISTTKREGAFTTRICLLDRTFVDFLIKMGFIEMPETPQGRTSRAVIKHIGNIPKEALGAFLAGWFDSDWTIREAKNRAIEIHCALDTRDRKFVLEQMKFILYLVSAGILPEIMSIDVRFHPKLRAQVEDMVSKMRNMDGKIGEKIRMNEYSRGKVGIGVRVKFKASRRKFSNVFKWWKANIMPYMYRKDKIEVIKKLCSDECGDEMAEEDIKEARKAMKLRNKIGKVLVIRREIAEKLPFLFVRFRNVKTDLLPEEDESALVYFEGGRFARVVRVKKAKPDHTYDISLDNGSYYLGGMRNVCYCYDTGHAVMSTFHAASVEKLIQRLTGDPIRVPKTYIDNLNFVIIQNAVRLKGKLVRRVTSVSEIIGYDPPSDTFSYIEVFRWNPATDTFEFTGNLNSYMLEEKIAVKRGIPHNKKRKIYKELEKRANILKKIHESGVTDFYELFNLIAKIEKEGVI